MFNCSNVEIMLKKSLAKSDPLNLKQVIGYMSVSIFAPWCWAGTVFFPSLSKGGCYEKSGDR